MVEGSCYPWIRREIVSITENHGGAERISKPRRRQIVTADLRIFGIMRQYAKRTGAGASPSTVLLSCCPAVVICLSACLPVCPCCAVVVCGLWSVQGLPLLSAVCPCADLLLLVAPN